MKSLTTLLLAIALCAGCATQPKGTTSKATPKATPKVAPKAESASFLERRSESRRLASAIDLLENGDSPGAARLLEAICAGKPVAGVTDEALFRLALLSLKSSPERPASAHGQQLLKRLKREYPSSPWTLQAAPLIELIGTADDLKRQNRSCKSSNQSLNKEINELNRSISELNKNIEQLKHLDLELEQKAR